MNTRRGSNVSSIKQSNRALILNTIKQYGGASRSELAKLTGLSKGGITPIINEMLAMRLIKETDVIDTDSGRKPIQLEIDSNCCSFIALDWTRNSYTVAIVDFAGNIADLVANRYSSGEGMETVIINIKNTIASMIERLKTKKIIGIGVVAPGPLDYKEGIVLTPPNFHGWANIPIGPILNKRFNLPVFVDNNANAHAIAEKNYGLGKRYSNFISVVVDEGIGAGIIINDSIYRGNMGFSSEVGHITIDMNGPKCQCGNVGCLEVYATVPRILDQINKQIEFVGSYNDGEGYEMDWDEFINSIKANDPLCLLAMERVGQYISNALITLINLFDPQAIIIGSQLAMADNYIRDPLRKFVYKRVISREFYLPHIYTSNLSYPSLRGGATIAIDEFISGTLGDYEELIAR